MANVQTIDPAEAIVPLKQLGKAWGTEARTAEAILRRHGVPVLELSRKIRGPLHRDAAMLLRRLYDQGAK